MEKQNESVRDRLLARLPQPENLAAYREEVTSTLEKNEKRLRWEKWGVGIFWLYAIGFFLLGSWYRGEQWLDTPHGHAYEFVALLLLLCGVMELIKHSINRSRVELLREVKQVQFQMLELQADLLKKEGPSR
jgi:hypothetical protein